MARRRGWLAAAALLVVAGAATDAAAAAAPAQAQDIPVVIAVIDDGVNAYHDDYATDVRASRHPSTYLPGYPRTASPLKLTLDERDFRAARAADRDVWAGVRDGVLHWVPRTKLAGVVRLADDAVQRATQISVSTGENEDLPIIDNNTHGNHVASVAAGTRHGSCPRCLLVVIDTQDFAAGLRWAAEQPWIDVISNSWGSLAQSPAGGGIAGSPRTGEIDSASRAAAAAGKVVVFAAGNGATGTGPFLRATPDRSTTLLSPATGPPWVVTVGAASPHNRQATPWHNVPVDVIGFGQDWPAATSVSTSESTTFHGTSCSAPVVAGVVADALRRVRAATGHAHASAHLIQIPPGARRPAAGPLQDGLLTRVELVAAAVGAARSVPFDSASYLKDPAVTPDTALRFAYQGAGLLTAAASQQIAANILGTAGAASHAGAGADAYAEHVQQLRVRLWGPAP